MRVTCISNTGQSLSDQLLQLGYTVKSAFSISIGDEYEVFSMSLWSGAILLLLVDEHHLPNWFPLELFSIKDHHLPADWLFFSNVASKNGLQALWGYERMIADPLHYDGILERDSEALRHFYEEELLRCQHK